METPWEVTGSQEMNRSPMGFDSHRGEKEVKGWKAVGVLRDNGVSMRGDCWGR